MEQLIKDLLIANKTIVLPGIGALTLTDETKMDVMLLTYLKYDNRELKNAFAQKSNCSSEEADEQVSDWLNELIDNLNQGKRVAFSNLGYFFKNSDNEFEFAKDESNASETTPMNPISPDIHKEEKIEPTEEEIKSDEVLEEEHPESPVAEEVKDKDENEQKEEEPIEMPIQGNEPKEEQQIVIPTVDKPKKEKIKQEKVKKEKIKREKKPKAPKQKKSTFSRVMIVLAILILLLGAVSVLFFDKLKPFIFPDSKPKIESNVPKSEEVKGEPKDKPQISNEQDNQESQTERAPIVQKPESQPKAVQNTESPSSQKNVAITPPTTTSENGYSVIVGAFQDESNANRVVESLKASGNDARILQMGGLNMVSAGTFTDRNDAVLLMNKLGNCWILKK